MVCPWCCNKTYFSEVNSYVKKVTTVFKLNADDTNANYMRAYMKSNADFLGIKTPLREELSKPFLLKDKLEYVIDWDTVGIRSIFFDVMNFFMPWFTKRSYNYFQIKEYILKFIDDYVPNLQNEIKNKYNIYFSIYALERYKRIHDCRTVEFDVNMAYERYNSLFKNITMEAHSEYQGI